MTGRKTSHVARLVEKLARTRTPEAEIVIESGAGSLISRRLNRAEMESTRLSMISLRENAAARRNRHGGRPAAASSAPVSDQNAFVTVYTKPADIQSNATIRALEKKHITYRVIDISQDREALERLKALGYMQAPVVITDSDHWSGFRPDKIEEIANADLVMGENQAARRNRHGGRPAAASSGPKSDPKAFVTVYTKPADIQGDATIRALEKKNITYRIIDISQDQEALERLKALGYMQAPVVTTDSDHWSGFRPDKIEEIAAENLAMDSSGLITGPIARSQ